MKSLEEVLEYPSTILILGDVGTGKTVTAFAIAEHWRKEGYWIGFLDKTQETPKWIHDVDSRKLAFPPNVKPVLLIDDAHAFFYAQEPSMTTQAKKLDIINRARRHEGGCSVVYTTQDSTSLKKALIRMANIIIFKQPPLLASMDRPEVRELYKEADLELKKENYKIDEAYVISKKYRGLIKIEKPKWYSEEVSEEKQSKKGQGIGITVLKFFRGMGGR